MSDIVDASTLYDALWELVDSGATLLAVGDQPALLALTNARGSGEDADRATFASAAREEIINACRALDDQRLAVEASWDREGGAVMALLGLASGYRSAPLVRRRAAAAKLLGYAVETAFKTRPSVLSHAQRAVAAVADALWERDIRARARLSARLVSAERPPLSELAVDMLRRYEAYYSMFTPLSGLRADLTAAIELRREGDDELNRAIDFDHASLHDYATFLMAKREFEARYHGLWLFAQADIEQGVATRSSSSSISAAFAIGRNPCCA